MSMKQGEPDEDAAPVNPFPASKIKAQILRDEGVGRLSQKAVGYIGACSAVFVQNLVKKASSRQVLTLDMVQKCVTDSEKYDFLHQSSLMDLKEESAPRIEKKRKHEKKSAPTKPLKKRKDTRKTVPELASAPVKQAIEHAQHEPLNRGGIILDEDDYD